MSVENNPSDTIPEFDSEGGENVGTPKPEGMTLEEINALTGRSYKDLATAREAIKSTYSKVGQAPKADPAMETRLNQLELDNFYLKNPQYISYKDTIAAMGPNPSRVVETEAFQKIFTDLSAFEESKKKKSVLESNPRIGQAKTKIDEARDLSMKGRQSDAAGAAVAAVLEAYDS